MQLSFVIQKYLQTYGDITITDARPPGGSRSSKYTRTSDGKKEYDPGCPAPYKLMAHTAQPRREIPTSPLTLTTAQKILFLF